MSTVTPDRPSGVEEVRPRGARWLWLLPSLTFLVGLALGALVFGLPDDPPAPPAAAAEPSTGPEPSPSPGDLLVRVPEPCLAAAGAAEEAVAVVDRAVAAARSFDARGLQEAVGEAQRLRPRVEDLAGSCRSRAGQDVVLGDTVTQTPTPAG